MKPHQIISLMTPADFGGADSIPPPPDHYNHIHVGFHPVRNSSDGQGARQGGQWIKLIDRLNNFDNPTVPVKPSKDAIPGKPGDHAGELIATSAPRSSSSRYGGSARRRC